MNISKGVLIALSGVLVAFTSAAGPSGDLADIQILSAAVRDLKIAGATLILQKNGDQSLAISTDAAGKARVGKSAAEDPSVLLIVRSAWHSTSMQRAFRSPWRIRSSANTPIKAS